MQKTLLLILSLMPLWLFAQINSLSQEQAAADSIALVREQEIASEFGFRDSNTLQDVAQKLKISNIKDWKQALNLESENLALDAMTLRKLGITPYRAFLAKQSVLYGYNERSTLSEVSATLNMPIQKLKLMLGYDDPLNKYPDRMSLQALEIDLDTIREISIDFNDNITGYAGSVMMVGMLVVFSALILISLIIGQLVHINKKKKSPKTITLNPAGKVKAAPKTISSNVIVAAITALHLHKMDLEERRKMVLTFRRTPTNQWKASAVLAMPNREMNSLRRPR